MVCPPDLSPSYCAADSAALNFPKMKKILNATVLFLMLLGTARADGSNDDAHNHDGSHPLSPLNCGSNYLLPGEVARLGSHSFMILGQVDEFHIIAEHRSGTPPHNYQFLFRVRLDAEEMDAYNAILKDSKTLPAFTTIYFDENGKQLDRTFFCLPDLPKIFGSGKRKGDEFEKLFPIRASLQKNPDHEGSFEIQPSVAKGKFLTLARDDFELLFHRYLPAYLPQDSLRKAIKLKGNALTSMFSHSPLTANEAVETASKRRPYMAGDGTLGGKSTPCPANYYLKGTPMPETIHSFLLLAELGNNTVLASHYYDQAPQNYQTILKLKLSDDELKFYRKAQNGAGSLPLLQTKNEKEVQFFCMESLRTLAKDPTFSLKGTIYRNSDLVDYRLGEPVGKVNIAASKIEVLVNRRLESLMGLSAVALDVQKGKKNDKNAKPEY